MPRPRPGEGRVSAISDVNESDGRKRGAGMEDRNKEQGKRKGIGRKEYERYLLDSATKFAKSLVLVLEHEEGLSEGFCGAHEEAPPGVLASPCSLVRGDHALHHDVQLPILVGWYNMERSNRKRGNEATVIKSSQDGKVCE